MTVVHAMLGNAAVAAGLALLALVLGYVCRSAAIRHAAWVLVLLKLVTPPLFSIPLTVLPASWGEQPAPPPTRGVVQLSPSTAQPLYSPTDTAMPAPAWWERFWPAGVAEWAIAVWVAGAVGWFVWQGRRIVRFRRLVRRAEGAPPEVAAAANRLAAALGITRPPVVKMATGIGSPMLWGWGRGTVVLFPRGLLDRLAPEARDTLLAHELAHFLRRDHWVRVLEFVATGLYWWHPAVWLARAGIEAAEEECCDAWVVGGLSASPRRYAEALLATVDYEAELRRPCLPPGACAANRSAKLLYRRLVGIIHADRPRRLRGGRVIRVVVVVGLLTQPVLRAATATPEADEPQPTPVTATMAKAPRPASPQSHPMPKRAEPRAWAATVAPGGSVTVLARDREMILRRPDGTDTVLGPGRPLALAFAPGGSRLTTAGPGPLVRTWDDRGGLIASASVPAAARSIAYTPHGTQLLVLDAEGGISVLDPNTLALLTRWFVEGPANSISCAPDGQTVAVSFGSWRSETGWVECWSIADGRRQVTYQVPMPVGASRFTPDGRRLVVGGWNGVVVWLALPGGALITERQLSKDVVATAAFSPDAGTLPLDPPPETAPPPSPVPRLGSEFIHGITNLPER